MKKFLAILMVLFLMAAALCITTFSAEAEEDMADQYKISVGDEVVLDDGIKPLAITLDTWWNTSSVGSRLGSMLGEGSLAAILILAAIVVVIGVLCFVVKKKKPNNPRDGE